MFWIIKNHPNTPVTIQREVEKDAAGAKVDVGTTPALWMVGQAISYGASAGPSPF